MPTEILDCNQDWMLSVQKEWHINGVITSDEFRMLDGRVGTSKSSYNLSPSQTRLTKFDA